jgi:hypothetical protein
MSFCLATAGMGEALMTSTHTSLAAARAPAMSPAAALLQIPSTLLLTLAASDGSRSIIDLQISMYCLMAAALTTLAGPAVAVVGGVVEVAGLLAALVEVVAGVLAAAVEVVAGALVAVEPLVVELPLLPQAAMSTMQSNPAANSEDRLAIIPPP